MEITKEEFEAYKRVIEAYKKVKVSGITNIFDTTIFQAFSGLSRETIFEIMKTYETLMKKYPDVRK